MFISPYFGRIRPVLSMSRHWHALLSLSRTNFFRSRSQIHSDDTKTNAHHSWLLWVWQRHCFAKLTAAVWTNDITAAIAMTVVIHVVEGVRTLMKTEVNIREQVRIWRQGLNLKKSACNSHGDLHVQQTFLQTLTSPFVTRRRECWIFDQ